jgi:hypothetical protein
MIFQNRTQAMRARKALVEAGVVMTDELLAELPRLGATRSGLAGGGRSSGPQDSGDERVTVHPQSRHSFLEELGLDEQRSGKGYNQVDCVSMTIAEVLTRDRHFMQGGFDALIRRFARTRRG